MFSIIISLLLIGLLLISIDRRSFLGGITFGMGALIVTIYSFVMMLYRFGMRGDTHHQVAMVIVYGIVPILFLMLIGWLIHNTRVMYTKEGKSFTAKLAAILGVNFLIVIPLFFVIITGAIRLPTIIAFTLTTISLLDIMYSMIFVAYLFYSFIYQMIPVKKKIDYIIILGAGVRSEEVTPLLKSRLDKALEYQERQSDRIKFVVSGGQGPDEPVSEAFAMRKYLLTQGVEESQILFEDQSTTTLENMTFSKRMIEDDWKQSHPPVILFSTNNYHVLRSAFYARKVGLKAEGIGAPIALYFLPNALLREYVALLVKYKWFSVGIAILVLAFMVITYLPNF